MLKRLSTLILLCYCLSSLSAQIFVDIDASTGGDGISWATAYTSLQTALSNAVSGDELWVAEGSYFIIGDTDDSFEIPTGVQMFGGFIGIENNVNQRNWSANNTILDGTDFSETVVYFENCSSSTLLDGFTIQNGDASGTGTRGKSGAAIFIETTGSNSCDPQIRNCTILNNNSVENGGAIYMDGSFSGSVSPSFENVRIENNSSQADGGAIYGNGTNGGNCTPTFTKCIFRNNTAESSGGAIFFHGGGGNASAIIKQSDFDSNTADGNGGALYSIGSGSSGNSTHTITNTRFYNNQAFAAGAIYNLGINNGNASPTITNCTFYLNEALGNGGTGGAIYNNGENNGDSSPVISNCIIYGNIGPYNSHVFRNIYGTPIIKYSLVDAADCDDLNSGEGSNVTCGAGMIYDLDPLFEAPEVGNLRLMETSPALEAGDDTDNSESEDLDCNPRLVNTIDLGAYELPDDPLPVEMATFDVYLNDEQVDLQWITLSETNNELFEIERSGDGYNFEKIKSIPGAGNTTDAKMYKAFDAHPFPGISYYRLKMIDFGEHFTYSEIKSINLPFDKISMYPNPVNDQIFISYSQFKNDIAHYSIYNCFGQLMQQGSMPVENNISFLRIDDVENLPSGYYILSLHSTLNGDFSQRFVKARE